MVYIFGLFGFIMGFAIGLGLINVLLRHHSGKEIKENRGLRWYGLLVWVSAFAGLWLGLQIFNNYF